jgi:hypothetical protein
MGQLFKMDYSAVSKAAKRFEQKSKVNHKIREIKQKMMEVLKENFLNFTWYYSIILTRSIEDTMTLFFFAKIKVF